jgi:hypothetical protein
MSASEQLEQVIAAGQEVIRQQQLDNSKMFQSSIASHFGSNGELTLDLSSFDADLKEQFNVYARSPQHQVLFTNIQIVRRLSMIQVLLNAAIGKMIGVETPAADQAIKGDAG